nr:hypothetical protein [Bacillus sp. N35-10-4]
MVKKQLNEKGVGIWLIIFAIYVNPIGQSWTTLETMQNSNLYKKEEMFILS